MKFNNIEELEKFKDTSMRCICGQLMTGMHMNRCSKLKKLEQKLKGD